MQLREDKQTFETLNNKQWAVPHIYLAKIHEQDIYSIC